MLGGIGEGVEFERRRDVEPASAFGPKGIDRGGKLAQRPFDLAVGQVLSGGLGEAAVDQGRLAEGNGVADDGIAVGHGGLREKRGQRLNSTPSACRAAISALL